MKQGSPHTIPRKEISYEKKHVYFSADNGAGAIEANEGNLGVNDEYGFDESDSDDDTQSKA